VSAIFGALAFDGRAVSVPDLMTVTADGTVNKRRYWQPHADPGTRTATRPITSPPPGACSASGARIAEIKITTRARRAVQSKG
jgi:hypothetical protein